MKIKITAKITAGLGCIKGDTHIYDCVRNIEDKATYWNLIIPSRNKEVRVNKRCWFIEKI